MLRCEDGYDLAAGGSMPRLQCQLEPVGVVGFGVHELMHIPFLVIVNLRERN